MVIFSSLLQSELYNFNKRPVYLKRVKGNFYQKDEGGEVLVKESFFVKMKASTSIDTILKRYDLRLLKQYSKQICLVKSTHAYSLELIEQIDSDETTLYAYPNISKKIDIR